MKPKKTIFQPADAVAKHLLDVSSRLQWATDQLDLMKTILDGLKLLGFSRARLYRFDNETNRLVSEATRGLSPKVARTFEQRAFSFGKKETQSAYHWSSLQKGQPLVVVAGKHGRGPALPQVDKEGRTVLQIAEDPNAKALGKEGVSEWLEIPLISRGEVLGKISVDKGGEAATDAEGNRITPDEFRAAVLLSRMCALILDRVSREKPSWERFEEEVGGILRALGAKVRQNVNLAGNQVDLLAEEQTPSGQTVKLLVECKSHKAKVGVEIVRQLSYTVGVLKQRNLVDRALLVSASGYTQNAHLLASQMGIEALILDDLRNRLGERKPLPPRPDEQQMSPIASQAPRRIFVIMPFGAEYDDVYHLGIRETAEALNYVCERADQIDFTGSIPEQIVGSIQKADVIVAELSSPNPNCYYEVGIADTLRKPVIRLTRDATSIPFDLKHMNHIIYTSIRDLRDKLARILNSERGKS